MSAELTELAAKLERTARDKARERVALAIGPLTPLFVQELRRAAHKVVGDHADVIVLELVNGLQLNTIERLGPIAERQSLEDIIQRLTAEAQA